MGSTYVNKMQKFLELMNIKLKNVISQIHGASGIRVIKAIPDGGRDGEKLLSPCDVRIRKNRAEDAGKALRGNYSPQYPVLLKENMRLRDEHQNSTGIIEKEIGQLLDS
jgi:small nuclear ribonucleoprotein (snRNP)-like protein